MGHMGRMGQKSQRGQMEEIGKFNLCFKSTRYLGCIGQNGQTGQMEEMGKINQMGPKDGSIGEGKMRLIGQKDHILRIVLALLCF